ncbi:MULTISPECIES: radical SAM protein [unclassified Methylobacterium]|uniref:B12-binding domain-containing radical SAM protein n=1 Tax=unclassified Methylobacterium TaxID=2615210 RepID=UPI002269E12D|nr:MULTISPECIES: radical SAM protein [unclassified Methylobacterium]
MSLSERVLFVSAGMSRPKKRDHPLSRRQLYLNYGALTLATILDADGHASTLSHGEHAEPSAFLEQLHAAGLLPSRHPVMLSLPSFYALGWAKDFCSSLKARFPESRIVAGGRWVTDPDPDWLRRQVPEIDHVVTGLAEGTVHGLIGVGPGTGVAGRTQLPGLPLDHELVDGFDRFQPSIEASRGCGMGCSFCEERDIRLSPLRDPSLLADHMERVLEQYGGGGIHPYLQSSFFMPSTSWASRLRQETERRGLRIPWRCETRVDAMKPETVAHLAAAGMRVIDLGLETASPTQVLAMNKSDDVDRYLRSASDLLRACAANGVWVKANVLIYAGETARTIGETRAWLDEHAHAIKGVSVGPVVVFGPPRRAASLLADLAGHGASAVDPEAADICGITQVHPSREINADAAETISLDLSRRYMTEDDYFDLKSFSYYPRGYGRNDFEADVRASDPAVLPFRTRTRADA